VLFLTEISWDGNLHSGSRASSLVYRTSGDGSRGENTEQKFLILLKCWSLNCMRYCYADSFTLFIHRGLSLPVLLMLSNLEEVSFLHGDVSFALVRCPSHLSLLVLRVITISGAYADHSGRTVWGIKLSSPAQTLGSCVCSVFVLSCVGSGPGTDWSPVQGALTIVHYSMVWVRERTIPTERPPLVGEAIANFCW
jgi:hypothetical protein